MRPSGDGYALSGGDRNVQKKLVLEEKEESARVAREQQRLEKERLAQETQIQELPVPSQDTSSPRRLKSQVAVRVKSSEWDGAVPAVVEYLRANLKDFNSAEWVEWSPVADTGSGYMVRCKYRAKNSFGAYDVYNQVFTINSNGDVTGHSDY